MESTRYDLIIIGAGHNGLTTAALLAQQGRSVLVLERRDRAGGIAAGEEIASGYRTAGLLHDTTGVRPSVFETLRLERYGLERAGEPPTILSLGADGALFLHHAPEKAAQELRAHSARDAERYVAYRAFLGTIRSVVRSFVNRAPPVLEHAGLIGLTRLLARALKIRRLGRKGMMELLRIVPMCVADWLNEWFDAQRVKTALAGPALYGDFVGPWSGGTNANLILHECLAEGAIAGGPAALVRALEAAARDAGVRMQTGVAVTRILVERGSAVGVELENGETLEAGTIAAACTPQHTLLDLLRPQHITHKLAHGIEKIRARGTTARLSLAIEGDLAFSAYPHEPVEFTRIADSLDDMERAFDPVKYGRLPERPILDIHVPTVSDPALAPAGQTVASILIHFVPYEVEGGWTDDRRRALQRNALAVLEQHAPGLSDRIVGAELLVPPDLEQRYGLTGGHIYHGEHALDQRLIRPSIECARFATPIRGLYLCGSGSFPGGGITCAPGALAAAAIQHSESAS